MKYLNLAIVSFLLLVASCTPGVDEGETSSADGPPMRHDGIPLQGRWNIAPGAPEVAEMQAEMIEQLEAIGYSAGTMEAGEFSGVVLHKEDGVMPGYNLYNSGHDAMAAIMDMDGKVLHTWDLSYKDAFGTVDDKNPNCFFYRRVMLMPGGELIAIFEGLGTVRMDKDSNLIWAERNGAHHDLTIDYDGNLLALTRKTEIVDHLHEIWPCTQDYVSTLSLDGEPIHRFGLIKAFEDSDYAAIWNRTLATYDFDRDLVDTMHVNTINLLDGSHADKHPGFKKGNLLMSSLSMSTIFTVNPETELVEWAWQGGWHGIHEPSLLENGDLLFYVNSMFKLGNMTYSQVLQVEPVTKEVRWQFGAMDPPMGFISPFCGTAARLPNGNTLIAASESGRALETTHDGELVWDYYSPYRTGENDELVGTLFHVERLPLDTDVSWMDE